MQNKVDVFSKILTPMEASLWEFSFSAENWCPIVGFLEGILNQFGCKNLLNSRMTYHNEDKG